MIDLKSNRRRQPGQDASRFKTDEDSGKMIIDNDSDSDEAVAEDPTDVVGTAYREAITSVDGFTRGPNGKIKFNKDTKKRRREEEAMQDVEMGDAEETIGNKSKKPKKKSDPAFGHEFKAKVCVFENYDLNQLFDLFYRKLAATSKREGLTHMPICLFPKPLKRVKRMVLQENDNSVYTFVDLASIFSLANDYLLFSFAPILTIYP